jgi:hypothetical protein
MDDMRNHGDSPNRSDQERLTLHILPTAGTMVGVCVTLIGLVKIVEVKTGPSKVDLAAAAAAVIFLGSAIASYLSLRGGTKGRTSPKLEWIADGLFIAGLVAITGVSILFALELI